MANQAWPGEVTSHPTGRCGTALHAFAALRIPQAHRLWA
jgi:hypothetical protein